MHSIERYFLILNKWLLVLLLGAMAVIVFANVSLRYLTNFSLIWAEEVARYLMIWMTFLGAGLALRVGGHVAISNFQEMLPTTMQRALRFVIMCLLLSFFVIMIWMGIEYIQRARYQMTPATRISFGYIYMAMPIGFTFLIIHMVLIAKAFVMENRFRDVEIDFATRDAAEAVDETKPRFAASGE